jgi:predicted metal-dependent phosphoesterase TrpH
MKGSPFTRLCQEIARVRTPERADLHLHTTYSDGTHTPESLVHRAIKAGLKAIAVTDHDTVAGVAPAIQVAGGRIEVITGVEITSEFEGREVHLLGYFFDPTHPQLSEALSNLQKARRERLLEMADRLPLAPPELREELRAIPGEISLGRRHLAHGLIRHGKTRSLHDAFQRCLSAPELKGIPKYRLPVAQAIHLVHEAGGVSSLAHPPLDTNLEMLFELQKMGLKALECEYPWANRSHGKQMRGLANQLDLLVTGGSDSHDPAPATRGVGARTITLAELDKLRPSTLT